MRKPTLLTLTTLLLAFAGTLALFMSNNPCHSARFVVK